MTCWTMNYEQCRHRAGGDAKSRVYCVTDLRSSLWPYEVDAPHLGPVREELCQLFKQLSADSIESSRDHRVDISPRNVRHDDKDSPRRKNVLEWS